MLLLFLTGNVFFSEIYVLTRSFFFSKWTCIVGEKFWNVGFIYDKREDFFICPSPHLIDLNVICPKWNFVPRLTRVCWAPWRCSFFAIFLRKCPLWEHQNWLFKQKLGIEIASNIVNPVALIILTVFNWKRCFWGKFG